MKRTQKATHLFVFLFWLCASCCYRSCVAMLLAFTLDVVMFVLFMLFGVCFVVVFWFSHVVIFAFGCCVCCFALLCYPIICACVLYVVLFFFSMLFFFCVVFGAAQIRYLLFSVMCLLLLCS